MIRSSRHTLKFANSGKMKILSEFLDLYKSALEFYIGYLWSNRIGSGEYVLDVSQGLYVCPKFLDASVKHESRLTGRALKCASTQASAIVRAVLNKRMKDESRLEWKKSLGIKDEKLEKKLLNPPTKPNLNKIYCDLNSITSSLTIGRNSFDYWLVLSSLFKDLRGFRLSLPLKNFDRAKKWSTIGEVLNGISLGKGSVTLRYDVPDVLKRSEGTSFSIDQGLKTMLTTSREDIFPLDPHGHNLESIIDSMARCKNGSKGFHKKVAHRKNYVNWLVKQLDLSNVKEIKLEKITNIKYGRKVSLELKHWSNPLIQEALTKRTEELGVILTLVDNAYNSQRCNHCGWTQKSNRNKKEFLCKNCNHSDDADANASKNIDIRFTLFELPFGFMSLKKNLDGFFWNPLGIYSKDGEDLIVPPTTKNLNLTN